jgi:hypothetical protein
MEKAVIIGKRIECIIGIILLVPVFLGVIAFVICLFKGSNDFFTLDNLSETWSYSLNHFNNYGGSGYAAAGATSSAPIYLGLMAIAGVWLIKDSFKYLFMKSK